jgi:hypothetical protein
LKNIKKDNERVVKRSVYSWMWLYTLAIPVLRRLRQRIMSSGPA